MVEFAAFDIRNQMQLPFIKINPVIIVFSASQMQHYSLCHLTLSVFPSSPQRYMLPVVVMRNLHLTGSIRLTNLCLFFLQHLLWRYKGENIPTATGDGIKKTASGEKPQFIKVQHPAVHGSRIN